MAQTLTVDMRVLSAQPTQLAQALSYLGIPADATLDEAVRRYRALVRQAHPDLQAGEDPEGANDRTARINAAWEIVRPAAEALDAHRRARAAAAPSSPGTASVIAAEDVLLGEPRLIPIRAA